MFTHTRTGSSPMSRWRRFCKTLRHPSGSPLPGPWIPAPSRGNHYAGSRPCSSVPPFGNFRGHSASASASASLRRHGEARAPLYSSVLLTPWSVRSCDYVTVYRPFGSRWTFGCVHLGPSMNRVFITSLGIDGSGHVPSLLLDVYPGWTFRGTGGVCRALVDPARGNVPKEGYPQIVPPQEARLLPGASRLCRLRNGASHSP